MRVVHANWSDGAVHLWAEAAQERSPTISGAGASAPSPEDEVRDHPFAAGSDDVASLVRALGVLPADGRPGEGPEPGRLVLLLPTATAPDSSGSPGFPPPPPPGDEWRPIPSPTLAHAIGHLGRTVDVAGSDDDAPCLSSPSGVRQLRRFAVPTVRLSAGAGAPVLEALDELNGAAPLTAVGAPPPHVGVGQSVKYLATCVRLARHVLAQQRFVPTLVQDAAGALRGVWQPWLADEPTMERARMLLAACPPVVRAPVDAFAHEVWAILDDFLLRVGDALCRRTLLAEGLAEAIQGRDGAADPHVAWLTGLLGLDDEVHAGLSQQADMVKRIRHWISGLEDRGSGAEWRLCLRLGEPIDMAGIETQGLQSLGSVPGLTPPGEHVRWALTLHLQSVANSRVVLDAADIWLLAGGGSAVNVQGQRVEGPQELLLGELGRAARFYKPLEKVLEQADPTELDLSTAEAYRFLREVRPVLMEQGFGVEAPDWWQSPTVRLGARLRVESEDLDLGPPPPGRDGADAGGMGRLDNAPSQAPARSLTHLGLNTLVNYRWEIAVGATALSLEQFERLAAQHSPLVMLGGRWVEIRPEDVKAAVEFIRKNPGGQMEVGRALRLAYASDPRHTGIAVLGMDATGWVNTIFGEAASSERLPMLASPEGFVGTLRPYQLKGMSWLAFLDRLGLGACLADDMGLGKTVQLLALLAHERAGREGMDQNGAAGEGIGPTLLVVPMSVVGNWIHEAKRFTPALKILVHHGLGRLQGAPLARAAAQADMVITTYALAHRDRDQLAGVPWRRVVLDEAQSIKNPSAKQTQAIRSIATLRRVALTGTPVENRLGELWSIMEFLNPGYLEGAHEFRRHFAIPIERYHDRNRASQLRGLVQPFVLRRLKRDPAVIADLPEKVESREYCFLTPEQAALYQTCVTDMLSVAERTEGIQRRGVVLAGLIKLKQICNHPGHFLKELAGGSPAVPEAARSGKCLRLVEMLSEVLAAGDQALVFTQFREMGHMLAATLRHDLDRDVLFLHGGTPQARREEMIKAFQKADGAHPIFVLSLKAGGVGLNLTAANHVFHFDRWWNPAVEAQATDRAYRIGQTRTVQVHKFVVSGTLEERIDQMIEQKMELMDQVIGSGETWLTELSTSQLKDLLTLRWDAVGDEEDSTVRQTADVGVPREVGA